MEIDLYSQMFSHFGTTAQVTSATSLVTLKYKNEIVFTGIITAAFFPLYAKLHIFLYFVFFLIKQKNTDTREKLVALTIVIRSSSVMSFSFRIPYNTRHSII